MTEPIPTEYEQRAGTKTRVAVWRDYEFELRSDEGGDGRSFSGYAAVFGSPTKIASWEGNFTETVERGAFKKTLQDRTPVLMFDHGKHPSVGSMPIGQIIEIREDARGLFVQARLYDNPLVEPVRQAIEGGSISGMSFRFEAIRDRWSSDKKERQLLELRVPELGPVVFPAYTDTTANVRDERQEPMRTQRYTVEERREQVRRLQAGLSPIPGVDRKRKRKLTAAELAQRQRQVAALYARSGIPHWRPGMTQAERIALAEQVTGHKVDPAMAELERSNPYGAQVERERRERERRAEREARGRARVASMTPPKYAVGFIGDRPSDPPPKPRTPAESWRARVERRTRYGR